MSMPLHKADVPIWGLDRRDAAVYRLSPGFAWALWAAPLALTVCYMLILAAPWTHVMAIRLLDENGPVEFLTFVSALAGGLICMRTAVVAGRRGEPFLIRLLYAAFACGMVFIAGEEVAWGQQFLHFATPESWRSMNAQGETTIHNLAAIQGHTEYIRIVFSLGGLAGIWLGSQRAFKSVRTPRLLLVWFVIITAHSIVDAANDAVPVSPRIDFYVNKFSEMTEMYIGCAGLAYAWLNGRMLEFSEKE